MRRTMSHDFNLYISTFVYFPTSQLLTFQAPNPVHFKPPVNFEWYGV